MDVRTIMDKRTTAKIESGIPIVTMKSSAGFTSREEGCSLIDALQRASKACCEHEG